MYKIGLDLRMVGTKYGGIGRYSFNLAKHILTEPSDFDFILFYNSGDLKIINELCALGGNKAQKALCDIRHYSIKEQLVLPGIMDSYSLDLIHFMNFNAPLRIKTPFVATVHDAIHHKIGGVKKSRFLHFFAYKKVFANCLKKAKQIITVSESSKIDLTDLGARGNKIKIIYEAGFLKEIIPAAETMLREMYYLPRPYIIFAGVLQRNKNIVNLVKGFSEFLRNSRQDVDLVIVGKVDPHYPDIKNQALKAGNPNRVVFTGEVSDEILAGLFSHAECFASASVFEGFGLPGVEAMGFGLPLMVSDIPVFNEIYDNAAVYFDPYNPSDIAKKFSLLFNDDKFKAQIAQNALNRGNNFSWQNTAQETLLVYKQALNSKIS